MTIGRQSEYQVEALSKRGNVGELVSDASTTRIRPYKCGTFADNIQAWDIGHVEISMYVVCNNIKCLNSDISEKFLCI